MEIKQSLKLQIVEAGQKAIDAYLKKDMAEYCRYLELQNKLKDQLELEEIKGKNFEELLEGIF